MKQPNHNVVGWFEIPVRNMGRASKFYEAVFDIKLQPLHLGPLDMALFPGVEKSMGSSGSLIQHEFYTPSADGVLIYFTAFSGDVATELSRVEAAGGTVLVPKKLISKELGHMGVFVDTEGNRIAVHSRT
ncbi:MAG: glyoxalase [Candidatus Komeilibacteria bacterium RIFCSPLOWO2_01_FULL_52_15]|uniref:Glyoxalase n=2 Tax=Candidatus Komeiliibacteriota TaxID=1817908 RepID=A0A1G2BTW1_9BACT|nr:MAG: glyoxalase [Candidatus Komeilibacteria bacterium RIFCSPHIGHO2_01_FULL_52_14]OGY91790.1 MAG: glyoxalase [Candidatus Komeilibacteria bacterium RIFCSPLOWO2_01_FULL_52_15]